MHAGVDALMVERISFLHSVMNSKNRHFCGLLSMSGYRKKDVKRWHARHISTSNPGNLELCVHI